MRFAIFRRNKVNPITVQSHGLPKGTLYSDKEGWERFSFLLSHLDYDIYERVGGEYRKIAYRDVIRGGSYALAPRIARKEPANVELNDGSMVNGKWCPFCGAELCFSDFFYYCDNRECTYFDIPVYAAMDEDVLFDTQENMRW